MKTTILRILKNALQQFIRSGWLTAASVLMMTLTFFIISIVATTAYGSNLVLKYFESKPQVSAFFKDEATEEDILNIKRELEQTGLTTEVSYVSKEEAFKIYLGQHQDEPILLESITAKIFPASLDVRAKSVDELLTLVSLLEGKQNIEEIVFYKDIVESLKNWVRNIRLLGGGLIAVLLVISVLIVLISIGMGIATQKSEVEVMRLVGATSWYIRWPFILSGALAGVLSAFLAVGILALSSPFISSFLGDLLRGTEISLLTPSFILTLLGAEVIFAALLGALGSFLAVWKYLRY